MNSFVAKLDFDTREDELRFAFKQFGEVFAKFTGRSNGFAFVEMSNEDVAINAIHELNETAIDGRILPVFLISSFLCKFGEKLVMFTLAQNSEHYPDTHNSAQQPLCDLVLS